MQDALPSHSFALTLVKNRISEANLSNVLVFMVFQRPETLYQTNDSVKLFGEKKRIYRVIHCSFQCRCEEGICGGEVEKGRDGEE